MARLPSAWMCSSSRRLLFLLVIFQLPLFRTACRTGMCEAPLHAMLAQVAATVHLPPRLLAALLYPGALLRTAGAAYESQGQLVLPPLSAVLEEYNMTLIYPAPVPLSGYRLELIMASYLIVAGSIQALFQATRMAFLGCLLAGWGWLRGTLKGEHSSAQPEIYPAFILFFVLSFLALPLVENRKPKSKPPYVATLKPAEKKVQ